MENQKVGRPQRIAGVGEKLVLSPPQPEDWSAFLDSGARASDDFMEGIEDLPVQERAGWL